MSNSKNRLPATGTTEHLGLPLGQRLIGRLEALKVEEAQVNQQLVTSMLYQRLTQLQAGIAELEALLAPEETDAPGAAAAEPASGE